MTKEDSWIADIPKMYEIPRSTRREELVLQELQRRAEEYSKKKQLHEETLGRLLPVEQLMRERIERDYATALGQLKSEVHKLHLEMLEAALDDLYPQIDMRFMSQLEWSDKNQCELPMFALFDVAAPVTIVEGFGTRAGAEHTLESWQLSKPEILLTLCSDTARLLEGRARRVLPYKTDVWTMAARLGASLTDNCRERIAIAVERFDRVLLVTLAPEWSLVYTKLNYHLKCQSSDWQSKAALSQQTLAAAATVQSGTVLVVGQKRDKFWSVGLSSSLP